MHIDEFKEYFHADERQSAKVTYCLFEVLFGSLCAVIAGEKGWFDIGEYILGHHDSFHACFIIHWISAVHSLTYG